MTHAETDQQRGAFEFWFSHGRCNAATARNAGVHEKTVYDWVRRYRWADRADLRDAELAQATQRLAVERKARMLDRHAAAARELIDKAREWLAGHDIESARDAIQALKVGIDLELRAEQLPTELVEVLSLTDDEILRELRAARSQAAAADPGAGGETSGDRD